MQLAVKADALVTFVNDKEDAWPSSTDILCWHCCHSFESVPIPLPLEYDDKRDRFKVSGTFCSWGCVKKYNLESSNQLKTVRMSLIRLLRKKWSGVTDELLPSPPRCALRAFGGWMSIEDFRAASNSLLAYAVLPPKMTLQPVVIEEYKVHGCKHISHIDLSASVDLSNVRTTNNDSLKIKTSLTRKKPLATNDLLKSLGSVGTQRGSVQ
jgi:hypothetical protein